MIKYSQSLILFLIVFDCCIDSIHYAHLYDQLRIFFIVEPVGKLEKYSAYFFELFFSLVLAESALHKAIQFVGELAYQ